MRTARALACLLAAATAAPCHADEFVNHTWTFLEVIAGTNTPVPNPNGLIDPGEGVRFSLTVTISPAIGSTTTYTPPPPPGIGTIAGLGSIFIDLLITGSASGSWGFIARDPNWALGDPGSPQVSSGVINIQAGQFAPPGQTANAQNPIPGIWHGVWTPSSYAPRNILFYSAPGICSCGGTSSLLVQYGIDPNFGTPLYVGKFVGSHHSQILIPIVPAPSAAPLLIALAALGASRRHRPHP